jgi:four helix bundle protein
MKLTSFELRVNMSIKRFEDVESWKKAREITILIYSLTSKEKFSKDWGLKEQVQRASVSIMSNIAEGFDSSSSIEFARFLGISRRSASEVQNQLYIALDLGYISLEEFKLLYQKLEETRRMITAFIKYLKNHKS